jgi:hypothetical protein
MNSNARNAIDADAESMSREDLVNVVRSFQMVYREQRRSQTFDSIISSSSSDSECDYIRAESDDPYHAKVLAYDQSTSKFAISRGKEIKAGRGTSCPRPAYRRCAKRLHGTGEYQNSKARSHIVYGKLPHLVYSRIYVFNLIGGFQPTCPLAPFQFQSHKAAPDGYILFCEIPLASLGFKPRIAICLRKIKWLYILPEPSSGAAPVESQEMCD